MITIALTKGRILDEAIKLFEKAGFDVAEIKDNAKNRKLIFELGTSFRVILAKSADVVTFTARGACDCGIVGKDTLLEMNANVTELADLNFGKCRFAVAAKAGETVFGNKNKTLCVGTKYPHVARTYFNESGIDCEIVKIEGSVELAPLLGVADCIVDIVESGSTLRANGLEVLREIAFISARLIANPASLKIKTADIKALSDILL
ncbi:MAG: ATP phosphoribosyltransferase [Christensenellaceae bacterium]|jgi:ATP phosphoribosyltransferase|nr:ATP phosphoribosyltransferase [Christensenellaceae bacterium]